ncbi:MAG TPA: hypothetical protein VEC06_13385 [Paucimonas sp.]|nr:hypothetical protein [Paucimonas sp.]
MNDSTEKSSKLAKVLRSGGKWTLGILAVLFVAHVVWVNSGSNEWKLESEKDGIRVSSMKSPGYTLKKYKVEMRTESKLSDIVFYMSDLNTGYDVGASDIRRLEEVVSPPVFYAYDNYKLDLKPFGKLDVMIVNHYIQDPVTKKVTINVNAAPNKKPVDPNVKRVIHLSNNFTLTPLQTGGTDVELVSEMDLGLPYLMQNLVVPAVIHEEFGKMREMMKKDKYKNGKPAFITELHDDPKVAQAQS